MLLTDEQIKAIGFKHVGKNVKISDKASFYGAKLISIGDNVRIDDFVIISASEDEFTIGSNIHFGPFTSLIGKGRIIIEDFCNFSSKVSVYSSNDDYSGEFMTSPMVPEKYTNITKGLVHFKKHTITGCGAVILPGVTIGIACSIGSLSLVNKNCDDLGVYAGTPAKFIKKKSDNLLKLEQDFLINK